MIFAQDKKKSWLESDPLTFIVESNFNFIAYTHLHRVKYHVKKRFSICFVSNDTEVYYGHRNNDFLLQFKSKYIIYFHYITFLFHPTK